MGLFKGPAGCGKTVSQTQIYEDKRMTFREFQGKGKKAAAAEMERAGATHNKQTQYGGLKTIHPAVSALRNWAAFLILFQAELPKPHGRVRICWGIHANVPDWLGTT